jgi:CHAD domain-containing protein
MAYRLQKGRKLNRSLKKAVSRQLTGAIHQLLTAGRENPDGIHEVRKHLKKVRAALRLIRTPLDDRYQPQNDAARDAARCLSTARDDEILPEIFERLTGSLPPEERKGFASVRVRLNNRQVAAQSIQAADRHRTLLTLIRLNGAVQEWPDVSEEAVRDGWKAGFKRARKAWKEVEQNAEPLRMHAWRKKVKTHWYQTRLLQDLLPGISPRLEPLRELSVLLGAFHDLAVFREQTEILPADFGTPDQVETLNRLAAAEQSSLLEKALALGKELFNRKPDPLTEPK